MPNHHKKPSNASRTIQRKWEEFKELIADDMTCAQIRDMRLAFFAGTYAVFVMQSAAIREGTSREDRMRLVRNWIAECQTFSDNIQSEMM